MHDPDRAKTTVLDGEPRQTWNGCSHVIAEPSLLLVVRFLRVLGRNTGLYVFLVPPCHRDLGRSTRTCRDLRTTDLTFRQVVLAVRGVFL